MARGRESGERERERVGENILSFLLFFLFLILNTYTRIRRAIIVTLSRKALSTKNVRRTSKRECGFEHEPFLLSRITVEMRARAAREATKYVTFNDKAALAISPVSPGHTCRSSYTHRNGSSHAAFPSLIFYVYILFGLVLLEQAYSGG